MAKPAKMLGTGFILQDKAVQMHSGLVTKELNLGSYTTVVIRRTVYKNGLKRMLIVKRMLTKLIGTNLVSKS